MSLKNIFIYAGAVLLGYLGFKFVFPLIAPFVIAFLIAVAIEPLVEKLSKGLHINKNNSVLLIILVFVLIGGALITFLTTKLIIELNILIANFPEIIKNGHLLINDSINWLEKLNNQLPPEVSNFIKDNSKSIVDQASIVGTELAQSMLSLLTTLPKLFLFSLFTLFLTYFMARDKYKIKAFILKPLHERHHEKALTFYREAIEVGGKYLRVQLILIILTILISMVALLALKVKFAISLSLATGVASIIPVIGTGLIFIPLIGYLFVNGVFPMAWYVMALYIFLVAGRHILEPKMLADTFNISALPLLFAIYAGYKLLGLEGMLIGIVVVILYQILVKAKIIVERTNNL